MCDHPDVGVFAGQIYTVAFVDEDGEPYLLGIDSGFPFSQEFFELAGKARTGFGTFMRKIEGDGDIKS